MGTMDGIQKVNRASASKVLQKYWTSIDKYDRKFYETGDINYKVQADLLRKNCKEIMQKVHNYEATKIREG